MSSRMTIQTTLTALLLVSAAALSACGGGGDSGPPNVVAPAKIDRTTALGATAPSNEPPSCPAAAEALVDITAVQGSGTTQPLEGQRVTVRGLLTADVRSSGQGGFYLQQADADNVSDASARLFIFSTDTVALQVGDLVQVTGTVVVFNRSGGDPLTALSASQARRCGAAKPSSPAG